MSYVACPPGLVICLSDEDIAQALNYFFKKCTLEVRHFVDKKVYEKISEEKDEILYYKGRILPSQELPSLIVTRCVLLLVCPLVSVTVSVTL